jgi:hypothetical protein
MAVNPSHLVTAIHRHPLLCDDLAVDVHRHRDLAGPERSSSLSAAAHRVRREAARRSAETESSIGRSQSGRSLGYRRGNNIAQLTSAVKAAGSAGRAARPRGVGLVPIVVSRIGSSLPTSSESGQERTRLSTYKPHPGHELHHGVAGAHPAPSSPEVITRHREPDASHQAQQLHVEEQRGERRIDTDEWQHHRDAQHHPEKPLATLQVHTPRVNGTTALGIRPKSLLSVGDESPDQRRSSAILKVFVTPRRSGDSS